MEMQKEGEDRNMSKAMSTSIDTMTKVPIKFVEKEERKQKGGYKYKTAHTTRIARNIGRKTGREESINTRHRLIETDKQTRNVREGHQDYYW